MAWLAPGAKNEAQRQKTSSARYIVYRDQMRSLTKIMIFAHQDAIEGDQPQQPLLFFRKTHIQ